MPNHHHSESPTEPIAASVRRLAWPILLSQIVFSVPSMYDALWLGRLGGEAQAAAGLVMTLRMTMISPLMALSLAGGAVVARCLGGRQQDDADQAASQALVLMVLSSASIGLLGLALARPLLTLAGADADVMPGAISYARFVFAGLAALELVPSLGYMMSGAGAPRLMLAMSTATAVFLVASEPLLVRTLGIEGAAIAFVGSHAAGACLGIFLLASGRAPVRITLRRLRPDWTTMGRILRIALPAVPQRGAQNLALSAITRLVASYGAPTLAAWVVVERIYNFAVIPGFALSRTVPALVGRNLGASRPERAAEAVSLIGRSALAINGIVFGVSAWLAPTVLSLFTQDVLTAPTAVHLARFLALGYLARSMALVYEGAQSGAGDTISPMVINLIALWVVQVPAAVILSGWAGMASNGIWTALVASWLIQLLLMAHRFRQGHWRSRQV